MAAEKFVQRTSVNRYLLRLTCTILKFRKMLKFQQLFECVNVNVNVKRKFI